MSEITLEKTHALLEKLAEFVMTKIPKMEARLERVEAQLEQKADKADLIRMNEKLNQLIDAMDAQANRLDIISIDMKAISRTLDVHEERLGELEEKVFGYRVREDYKK